MGVRQKVDYWQAGGGGGRNQSDYLIGTGILGGVMKYKTDCAMGKELFKCNENH